jgi:two-component system, NtrC family, sensor histidine kinase HydH
MTEDADAGAKPALRRVTNWFRPQDFAWVAFIVVLIAATPEPNYDAVILLPLLGAFQILEPRLKLFSSRGGQIVSIVLKLLLSYLLIGYSHGLDSYYASIFLIPIVSAATTFQLSGVIAVTAIACLGYFSFLFPFLFDSSQFLLTPEVVSMACLRSAFYAIVAFVVYEQAQAKREEVQRTQKLVAQLETSNRNLRRAETSLRRSERLAALGQLTAGLAHELRNPLGIIKASSEMLMKDTARNNPEVMSEMASFIRSEADRMNALIGSFLTFARPLQIHAVIADLRPVVADVLREQSERARTCSVELRFEANSHDDLRFAFDPDTVRLALSNLVQNAIQASQPGQSVEIRAEDSGERIEIRVADSGSGIDPEHLESIFNPFFTTKPQGVGLGLALVSKIVDEHGGKISVRSQKSAGTTFEISLPKEQVMQS